MPFNNLLKILITLTILISSKSYSSNLTEINKSFDNIVKTNQLNSALIGVKIIDLNNGKTIFSKNANKNFIPASNTKLLTSAAALLYLEKDFKYQTKLYFDKPHNHTLNNLYIAFSGDPSFTTKDLQKLLSSLKTSRINNINQVYFVNQFFSGRNTPINESQSSAIFAYGAPSSIYNLNENSVALELTPEKQAFNIKQISGEPLKFQNQLFVANKQQLKTCQFNGYNYDNMLILSGCLPKNTYTFSFAVQNPKLKMKKAVLRELSNLNITTVNSIKVITKLPNNTTLLAEHNSVKLDVLLKHMLIISDNLYAQTILRTIGYYYNGVGSIVSGKNAIFEILKNKLKLDIASIQLEDGAGISENDLLNPNLLANLLYKMSLNKDYKFFRNMLAIYGVTGTLKNFKGDELKGKVFAKTGTQTTSIALSGYLMKDNNRYAFSILINSLKEFQKSQAHNLEKELLESLSKHYD